MKVGGDCSVEATATLVRHTSQLAKENLCRLVSEREGEYSQLDWLEFVTCLTVQKAPKSKYCWSDCYQVTGPSLREDSAVANRDHEVSQIILPRNLSLAGGSSLVIGAIIGKEG